MRSRRLARRLPAAKTRRTVAASILNIAESITFFRLASPPASIPLKGNLERKVHRSGGMSHLADRNEVNARFRDLAGAFPSSPLRSLRSDSGRFRQLASRNSASVILSRNHVHSAESYKPSNLLEGVRLEFDERPAAPPLPLKWRCRSRDSSSRRDGCPLPSPYHADQGDDWSLHRRRRQLFKRRIPGVVFRVSRIFAEVPLTASTNRPVSVATPESRWRKFKACAQR